jgi:hypothetical protein
LESGGRSLGRGFADGARTTLGEPDTRLTVDTFIDSTAIQLRTSLDYRIRPGLDSTVAVLLDRVLLNLALAEKGLADSLRGPISDSLERLLHRNLTVARQEADLLRDALTLALAEDLRTRLRPEGVAAGRDIVGGMSDRLTLALRDSLRSAAEELAAGAIARAVDVADDRASKGGVMKNVWTIVFIVAGLVLLGFGVRIWRGERRARQALSVVTGAVQRQGGPSLRQEIKARAHDVRVEDWLHDFLKQEGHLEPAVAPGMARPDNERERP